MPDWSADTVVDVTRDDGVTRIVLQGDVDISTVGHLRSFVESECGGSARKVVIDLAAVEFVDSHGLHLFAETHRRLTGEDRVLAFVRPPDAVWRSFVITGLDGVFVVEHEA